MNAGPCIWLSLWVLLLAFQVAAGGATNRDILQSGGSSGQRLKDRATAQSGSTVAVISTGGTASGAASASSAAFTDVEDSVEKIVQDSFSEVEQGSEAVAVVNATAVAVGEAVASAFSEAETRVEVQGDGEAEARADSQAASFANATATAIVDAVSEATDGNTVAIAIVDTVALAVEIAEALATAVSESRTTSGTAESKQVSLSDAVARPIARVVAAVFTFVFKNESISEAYAEASVSVDESEAQTQTFGTSSTTGDGQAFASGAADAGTDISTPETPKEASDLEQSEPNSQEELSDTELSDPSSQEELSDTELSNPNTQEGSSDTELSNPNTQEGSSELEPAQAISEEQKLNTTASEAEPVDACQEMEDCEIEDSPIDEKLPTAPMATNTTDAQQTPTNSSSVPDATEGTSTSQPLEPTTENPKTGDKDDDVRNEEVPPALPPIESCGGNLVCIAKLRWEARKQSLSSPASKDSEEEDDSEPSTPEPNPPSSDLSVKDRLASLVSRLRNTTLPKDENENEDDDPPVNQEPTTTIPIPSPAVPIPSPTVPAPHDSAGSEPDRPPCRSIASFCCRRYPKHTGCSCGGTSKCLYTRAEEEDGLTKVWREAKTGRECACA